MFKTALVSALFICASLSMIGLLLAGNIQERALMFFCEVLSIVLAFVVANTKTI